VVGDDGFLFLVIGASSNDHGGAGSSGTPTSGRPRSEDHFYVKYVHFRDFLGLGMVAACS